jgi:hypothetical protein
METFRNMLFIELIRVICGYLSNIITSLLEGVSIICSEFSCLLQEYYILRNKFKLIEKTNPSRALQKPQDINFFNKSYVPSILLYIG